MNAHTYTSFTTAPDLGPLLYNELADNLQVRFYGRGAFAHGVTINLTGPEEQSRFLASLDTIAAELRHRLASTSTAQPSQP